MFKHIGKYLIALSATVFTSLSFAAVDVNKATEGDLTKVKGIGPAIAERIVQARKQGGDFKSWADLISRVKGIGEASAGHFSAGGLTVNGQALKATSGKEGVQSKPAGNTVGAGKEVAGKAGEKNAGAKNASEKGVLEKAADKNSAKK